MAGNLPDVFMLSLDVRSGTQPVFQFCNPPKMGLKCPVRSSTRAA